MAKRIRITDDGWRFLVAVLKAAGYGATSDGWKFEPWNSLAQEMYQLENPAGNPNGTALASIKRRIQRLCPSDDPSAAEPTIETIAKLDGLNLRAVHEANEPLFKSIVDPKSHRISARLLLLRVTTSNAGETKPEDEFSLKDEAPLASSWKGSPQVAVLVSPFAGNSLIGFEPVENAVQVRAGQAIRIKVKLGAPAYLYVFWIRPNGEVQPACPWTSGEWEKFSEENEVPLMSLELPKRDKNGDVEDWTLEESAGLETLVALTRKRPLSPNERLSLKENFQQLSSIARLPIFPGVHVHVFRGKGAGARIKIAKRKTKDAATTRHTEIEERLIAWCDFASCLSFVNPGKANE